MTTFMVMSWTNGVPAKFARPLHYNVIRLPLPPLTLRLTMRHFVYAAILGLLSLPAAAQEKTAPTPSNLSPVEGMPPIPQSIVDGIARYGQFHAAEMQAWHPSKREAIITTALGIVGPANRPQLHYLDAPGSDRRQLTWYPNGVHTEVSPSFDPSNASSFIFLFDPAGTEGRSIYRYDLVGGNISLVTPSNTRYPPIWAKQGKWLAFDSSERNGKDRDLYVVQPHDPATKRRVTEVVDLWAPEDWSPDGTTILMNEVFSNAETYLWRVNVATGEKTPINRRGDGNPARWFNPRFSRDAKRVYAISDRGATGRPRIWRCEVAACAWTPVTADGLAVDINGGFEISSDGTLLAAVLDRGASTELHVIDRGTLRARKLPEIGAGIVSQIRWRPKSREVAFTLVSVKAQGDVYSVDTSSGTLTRWTFSETTFNPDVLPPPQVVEWKSFDGVPITGILYRPSRRFTGPSPVLVQIHGGPDDRSRARFQGRSNYFLNELGVALLYPNVRGSSGFGRAFEQMDNGRGREGAIKDIGAMLDWIAKRPDLDQNRVVLVGVSYGGWLALEAGVYYNDRIRGIIDGAGITDFATYIADTDPARQENRRQEYGDERDPEMKAFLHSISPITRASELKKPMIVVQGGKDTRVPAPQSRELVKAVQANKATVWYFEYPEANHDNLGGFGGNYLIASWVWFFKNFVLN
jgi:Tol biopolymer transport system component/dienelactone hydrolase